MILKNQEPYVYEFTNKRKLRKNEFIRYVQRKFLYTIRKYHMLNKDDVVFYKKSTDFRSIALDNLIQMLTKNSPIKIARTKTKATKIALEETTDSEADKIIQETIKGNLKKLKLNPKEKAEIRPLFLFLDEELRLYCKLLNLKFKEKKYRKDKISKFLEELESKHPEVKHAVVKSWLEIN